MQLVDQNEPPTALPPGLYNPDYSYQEICCTSFRSGASVEFPFVISDEMQHFPGTALKLYHYDGGSGSWEEVAISRIENKAVYAQVTETGYYVVASYQNVIKVDPSEDVVAGVSYKELSNALQYLIAKHVADGNASNRYEVHVDANGEVAYSCDGQFIPANTEILGGYDFSRSNMPNSAVNKTSIKPGSTTKAALIGGNKDYFFTDAANHYTDFEKTIIDGFIFNGEDNISSTVTAQAGAVHISGAWHVRDIRFKNCVFTENKGTMAGAVFVSNSSLIFFDNCVFAGNLSTAGGVFTDPVCNINHCRSNLVADNWSGGAVTVFEFELCGSEVEFHSCVFYNNETKFTGYTGAASKLGGTISIYGGAGEGRPVKIVNSTFTKNIVAGAATGSARSVYSGAFEAMAGTPVVLMNNILYGNTGPAVEVAGITEADVSYKTNIRTAYTAVPSNANDYTVAGISFCDIEGFSGTNPTNINDAPEFEGDADDKVMGGDGAWLTADDGLNVKFSSPVRKSAKHDVLPEQIVSTESYYYRGSFVDAAKRTRAGYEVTTSTFRTDIGAYEKNVKVMCVGDQNTASYTDKVTRAFVSYRKHLKDYANASNIEIEFVGSQEDEHGKHEGYDGAKVEYFYDTYDIASTIENLDAEIIFIMAGTNNIATDNAQAVFDKLYHSSDTSLISEIINVVGNNVSLHIGTLPTIKQSVIHNKVTDLNTIIKSYNWNNISNSNINNIVIDPTNGFYNSAGTTDDEKWPYNKDLLLMKDSGYQIIAESLKNALESEY